MIDVYGIRFNNGNKIYYFSSNKLKLEIGSKVLVETDKGQQLVTIVTNIIEIPKNKLDVVKPILRVADAIDIKQEEENTKDAKKVLIKAEKLAKRFELNMKFVDAHYTFDRNQLILTFISDNRVDFRNLAKELAKIYKTRIELRQIGVRDKAKEISGLGMCGRLLCCACFLNDIDSVSISMAKNQNLSLNPNKINGQCGRLLCCLTYEDEMYSDCKEHLPSIGDKIDKKNIKGTVEKVDVLNMRYTVIDTEGNRKNIKIKDKHVDKLLHHNKREKK